MDKATVEAPSNIAFVKYWGVEDLDRAIPRAPSLSMTLRRCATRTTVAFATDSEAPDTVQAADADGTLHAADDAFATPVLQHLDRLRTWAERSGSFRVATQNSFPAAAGLGSSASGFAALTLATLHALDTWPDAATRSALTRQSGSGSAARSVLGGYVSWPHGDSYAAKSIAPHTHWDLRDVIAVVETEPKPVSSRQGHQRAASSPFYEQRLSHLPERMQTASRQHKRARLRSSWSAYRNRRHRTAPHHHVVGTAHLLLEARHAQGAGGRARHAIRRTRCLRHYGCRR